MPTPDRHQRIKITPETYQRMAETVRIYHEAVVDAICGPRALPESMIRRMAELGVPRWPDASVIDQGGYLGAITAAMPDPIPSIEPTPTTRAPGQQQRLPLVHDRGVRIATGQPTDLLQPAMVPYEEWKDRVLNQREIPLSLAESQAVEFARQHAATYCRGLGNRVAEQTGQILVEADQGQRKVYEDVIRQEVSEGVKWRETAEQIRSRIGHATGDWSRDLKRIAVTEQNNAIQNGRGDAIKARHGTDARVARIPEPTACATCRRLFIGSDGKPKIFGLSEIQGQSNARDPQSPGKARRVAEYVPTLEAVHPWCQCGTTHVPDGWIFDENWDLIPESIGEA